MAERDNSRTEQDEIAQPLNKIIEGIVYQSTNGVECSFVQKNGMLGLSFTKSIDAFLLSPAEALAFARILRERALAIVS